MKLILVGESSPSATRSTASVSSCRTGLPFGLITFGIISVDIKNSVTTMPAAATTAVILI
jgi:hypothetical protein